MTIVECSLIEDCLAQRREGKKVSKKPFRVGERVRGTVENIALTPDSRIMALKTKDGYIIPEPFLNVIGAVNQEKSENENGIQYAEIVDDEQQYKKSEAAKRISKSFGSMKASEIIERNAFRSKYAVNFAIGGAVIGLIYAMAKQQNKFLFAAIGTVAGGLVGNYYGIKLKENEKAK